MRYCAAIIVAILIWSTLSPSAAPLRGGEPDRQRPNRPNAQRNPFIQLQLGFLNGQDAENRPRVLTPVRRDLRRRLARAKDAIQDERFSDAVIELDAILNGPETEDFFVDPRRGSAARKSLKGEALSLLATLPQRGRESYELQFGSEARRLLENAVSNGNIEQLAGVARRYFHTQAGYDAAYLGGRYYLNRAQPLSGAVLLQRLYETPHAKREYEPELSFLLATCWYLAGNVDVAQNVLADLKETHPAARIDIRGTETPLFDNAADSLDWLKSHIGMSRGNWRSAAAQWLVFRGDPKRNATSHGSMPLLRPRWRVRINDFGDEQKVRDLSENNIDGKVPVLPALQPLAVGDFILMRSPTELLAVDFSSGRRTWLYPWDADMVSDSDRLDDPRQQFSRNSLSASERRREELRQRLWDDLTYGQISSDGDAVYLIDELGFTNVNRSGRVRPIFRPGTNRAQLGPSNRLVALDLKTEGKLRWAIGQSKNGDIGDQPELSDAYFLGPPLPLAGQLYVLAEIQDEVRLIVLDSRSGDIEWSQQLAHFEIPSQTVNINETRRLAGATPSSANGVLVCPITAGAIVAVDSTNRSLLWGFEYDSTIFQSQGHVGAWTRQLRTPQPLPKAGQRWADSTVAIVDGRVLITPLDSDYLYCLDLFTGEPAWSPKKRDDLLFLACIHDGVIVLVGKHHVEAIRLADGRQAWTSPINLPGGAMPSGRGFLNRHHYFLPTTDRNILRIDISDGTFTAKKSEYMLGNLICYRGQIISQSAQWLDTFFAADSLQQLVSRRIQSNPNDAWALLHQGMLHVDEGRYVDALEPLRQAHQQYSRQESPAHLESTKHLLVSTMLKALEQDFVAHDDLIADVRPLLDDVPQQRERFLHLVGQNLINNGENARAFDVYWDIAQYTTTLNSGFPRELEPIERDRRVRHDRWLQGIFQQLVNTASQEDKQTILNTLDRRWSEILQTDSIAKLQWFLAHVDAIDLGNSVRLKLARRLIDSEEYLRAELLLTRVARSPDDRQAASANAMLARILAQSGQLVAARDRYEYVATRWPDIECLDGKTGRELFESLPGKISEAAARQTEWPLGVVRIESASRNRTNRGLFPTRVSFRRPVVLRQQDESWPNGHRIVFFTTQQIVGLADGHGNITDNVLLRQLSVRNPRVRNTFARVDGHLAIVTLADEIVALDLLSRNDTRGISFLWRAKSVPDVIASGPQPRSAPPWGLDQFSYKIDSRGSATGIRGPFALVGSICDRGICYQAMHGELRCVDPLSGEPLWTRKDVTLGSDLFGDDHYVFAVPHGDTTARIFSRTDGQELAERKVPPLPNRLMTVGRKILTSDTSSESEPKMRLSLFDPWTGTDSWSAAFRTGSKAWIVENQEIAVMQPNGQFVVLKLADGSTIIEEQLRPEPLLQSIHVTRSSDQYLLIANRSRGATSRRTVLSYSVMPTETIDARIYAFARDSGELSWPVPAVIEDYIFPIGQPVDLPVLVFLRHEINPPTSANRRRTAELEMLCIDKRDGSIVLEEKETVTSTSASITSVAGDSSDNTVSIHLPSGKSFLLSFTDQPRPPRPPAQTGKAASRFQSGSQNSGIGGILEGVLDLLQRVQPKISPDDPRGAEAGDE